jgi:SPOR domain
MTRMPINDRLDGPEHELYDEETPPRSIFAATWFRTLLVLIVVAVVGAITAPYIFDAMNPSARTSVAPRVASTPNSPPAETPATPPAASAPAPSTPAPSTASPSTPAPSTPVASEPVASAVSSSTPPASSTSPSAMSTQPDKISDKVVADKKDVPLVAAAAETKPLAKSMTATSKRTAARSTTATSAPAPSNGDWWVQVGAFRNEVTATKLTARLRAQNYSVEQLRGEGAPKTAAAESPAPTASGATSMTDADQYDVYVSGVSTSELNTRVAAKGLAAQPSGSGSVIKPSLPLRDAVALSKDLAVDGLKVQVRRAASAGTPSQASAMRAPAPSVGDTLYRVRVGAFPDRATAVTTLKELEAKGYAPFIARGGP